MAQTFKPPPHPFADKPSPYEETINILNMALSTLIQIIFFDILGNLLKYTFVPVVALIGYLGFLASQARKRCKRGKEEASPFFKRTLNEKAK